MSSKPSEKELFDLAVKIGVAAKLDGLTKAQVENLLSSLDVAEDSKASLLVTAAYAYRQASRLGRGRRTAKLVASAMDFLRRSGAGREEARRLLGMAKWVYESVERVRLPDDVVRAVDRLTFEDFVSKLARV